MSATSPDSRQQVWDVYAKSMELFDRKNADYGDAWRTNGWRGNLSRIFEKVQRVRNLAWRPDPRVPAVGDEQVLETLQDLLNTTAFAIINLIEEVEYGHETPRSQRIPALGQDYTPGESMSYYDQISAELPHTAQRDPIAPHEPGTQRITMDAQAILDSQLIPPMDPLPMMPDEQGAAEQRNGPGRKRVVRDNPQA